jgi:predicted MFS family arabinose efflux permease
MVPSAVRRLSLAFPEEFPMSRLEQAPVPPARPSLTYGGLLALPGARRAFGAAAVARLSFGMAGLSLLLLIHQATGSFAAAGAASGAFSAGTMSAPFKARLIDRRGQRAMLPALGLGAAAALLAMTLLGQAGCRNPAPYILGCAAAGALMPPVGAAMRARWATLAGGGRNLERAYSLDAATEETLFTAGPLLTGLAVTLAGPALPVLVTAALLAAGCVLMAASGTGVPAREPRPRGPAGPLAVPGFRVLLAIVLATSLGLGAIDVTITARAVADHHPGAAGCILAAGSLGSAAGGLAWGRRRHRSRASTQMTGLLVIMAGGIALAAVAPDLLLAGVALALTGTVLAPSAVLSYLCAERLAGPGAEASTWVNTGWNAGVAAGLALAGLAVGRFGPTAPLLAGAAVLACTALAVLGRRRVFDAAAPPPRQAALTLPADDRR